jgi:ankyrin repeat protein
MCCAVRASCWLRVQDEARHYIALGFPVDATDSGCDGWGVLHYAAKWDRVDVLELMLNYGADPLQEDWEGVRPHEIARQKGNYAFLKADPSHPLGPTVMRAHGR